MASNPREVLHPKRSPSLGPAACVELLSWSLTSEAEGAAKKTPRGRRIHCPCKDGDPMTFRDRKTHPTQTCKDHAKNCPYKTAFARTVLRAERDWSPPGQHACHARIGPVELPGGSPTKRASRIALAAPCSGYELLAMLRSDLKVELPGGSPTNGAGSPVFRMGLLLSHTQAPRARFAQAAPVLV